MCAVCGEVISNTSVPAKGHTFGEWEETKVPTCTEPGDQKAVCQDCEVEFTQEIPATGYTPGEWMGVTAPTCMTCGEEYTAVIPATGHQYGEWTVVNETTETK